MAGILWLFPQRQGIREATLKVKPPKLWGELWLGHVQEHRQTPTDTPHEDISCAGTHCYQWVSSTSLQPETEIELNHTRDILKIQFLLGEKVMRVQTIDYCRCMLTWLTFPVIILQANKSDTYTTFFSPRYGFIFFLYREFVILMYFYHVTKQMLFPEIVHQFSKFLSID